MTCNVCGAQIEANVKFCPYCGSVQSDQSNSFYGTSNTSNDFDGNPFYGSHPAGSYKNISFSDAVRLYFSRYTDFRGRSRRSEYWWVFLFNMIVAFTIGLIIPWLSWIWGLITLIPTFALDVRRLHDIGKSGWWLLIGLVPLAGLIVLVIFMCQDSGPNNRWGRNPKF